ncbi:uncharacterized protein LOC132544374 [Ylistrum balloti]|uniref:uncharacterized protein LOC132544374 n=1 Tax=Ylistrum balloti TaxID=509963 RepID=UPI002905EBB7|nr:uncharacterized protein LOC132544374 [Ylistrum balloti]
MSLRKVKVIEEDLRIVYSTRDQADNLTIAQPWSKNQGDKHSCRKTTIVMMIVIFIVGVAAGACFVALEGYSDHIDFRTSAANANENKSSTAVPSILSSEMFSDIATALIASDDERSNGSVFKTDPICRDLTKSSVFVFDCFHLKAFTELPDNSTIKCSYLNQVGLCIQALVENEYGVDCDWRDLLVILNLNAEVILERGNFNVKIECKEWHEIHMKKVTGKEK